MLSKAQLSRLMWSKPILFSKNSPARFLSSSSSAITQLDILDIIKDRALSSRHCPNFGEVGIVANQHILETTATLFETFIRLGVKPRNIFLAGKCYSTSPLIHEQMQDFGIHVMPNESPGKIGQYGTHAREINKRLWKSALSDLRNEGQSVKKLIVIDDGFRCVESMPPIAINQYATAFVEQTRAGFYSDFVGRFPVPHVAVAFSAAKKYLESPHIATAVLRRVQSILPDIIEEGAPCGVVGNGAIGLARAKYLLSQGHVVCIYDEDPNSFKSLENTNLTRMNSIEDVICTSNFIFGCTGKDITENFPMIDGLRSDKTFFPQVILFNKSSRGY